MRTHILIVSSFVVATVLINVGFWANASPLQFNLHFILRQLKDDLCNIESRIRARDLARVFRHL